MQITEIKELSKTLFESLLDEGKNYEEFVRKITNIANKFVDAYNSYNEEHTNLGQETKVDVIPHPFDNNYNYQVVECIFTPSLENVPPKLLQDFKASLIYASGVRSLEDNQIIYNTNYNQLVNNQYQSNNYFITDTSKDLQYIHNLIFLRHANASDTLDKGSIIPDDSKEGKWSALQDRWSDENGNPTYEGFKKFMTVRVCLNFLKNYENIITDIFNDDKEIADKLFADPSIMNNLIWNPQDLKQNLQDIDFNRQLKNHNIANKIWKLIKIGKDYNIEEFNSFTENDWNELESLFHAPIPGTADKQINKINNLARRYLDPKFYTVDDQQLISYFNTTIANQLKEAYTKYLYNNLNIMRKADYYVIMAQMTKDHKDLVKPYYVNNQGSLTTNIDEARHFANRNNKNNETAEAFRNTIESYPNYLWRVEKQTEEENPLSLDSDNFKNLDHINYLDQLKKDLNNAEDYKQFSDKYFKNTDLDDNNFDSVENPVSDEEALEWINNQFK